MNTHPNMLFIMTDQQHATMMSCAGNTQLQTPAMDQLAHDGIRFENAYCTNPVCVASRTSMATGMMPGRLGANDNGPGVEIEALPRDVDRCSLGKMVKAAGYDTFYGGKVHMCQALHPEVAGYDAYFPDDREVLPGACVDFIRKKRDRPFFAVASFINPHDICFAHRAHNGIDTHGVLELYREAAALPLDQLPPLPDNYAIPQGEPSAVDAHASTTAITPSGTMRREYDERDWRINRWIYHRLTEQVDRHIGLILDGLKEAGLEKDTLILFVSDHGNMDASHRLASKGFYYDESVRVPFIMKYEGEISGGRTDRSHLISTGLDILPTICDYAGVEKPTHLLGDSLRPLASGEDVDQWRSYVISENSWFRMVRSSKFKYSVARAAGGQECLVDMDNDRGEMQNLVLDPLFHNELVAHRRLLAEWIEISGDKEGAHYTRDENI